MWGPIIVGYEESLMRGKAKWCGEGTGSGENESQSCENLNLLALALEPGGAS